MKNIVDSITSNNTPNRLLRGAAVGMSAIAIAASSQALATDAAQAPSSSIPDKLKTALHQEIEINATPQRVYEVLLGSKQFTTLTGMPAKITASPGGAVSMFDGMITGRNIELVSGQRIVQAWRPGSWKPGVYSIVKFELRAEGTKTLVILDHTGFPEGDFESLGGGWTSHYWEPLKKYFP